VKCLGLAYAQTRPGRSRAQAVKVVDEACELQNG
jgi:hypothetical protein